MKKRRTTRLAKERNSKAVEMEAQAVETYVVEDRTARSDTSPLPHRRREKSEERGRRRRRANLSPFLATIAERLLHPPRV